MELTKEQKKEAIEEIVNYISNMSIETPTVINSDMLMKAYEYSALFKGTKNIESYLFFTDPHLAMKEGWEENFFNYINSIQRVYNSTPTSFIVCGGDWLGSGDTMGYACFKLGFIDKVMNNKFDRYYSVIGNHDTNYQGRFDETKELYTGELDKETIVNLWYRDKGSAYYSFNGIRTTNYVLDTGLDRDDDTMNDYKWQQLDWLANSLKKQDAEHSVIYMHISFVDYEHYTDKLSMFASNLGSLIEAYNNRKSVELNNKAYDFSGCGGRMEYVLSGHIHADMASTIGGVPCISSTSCGYSDSPNFDLCLADYDARKLHLVRIGAGKNRTINF